MLGGGCGAPAAGAGAGPGAGPFWAKAAPVPASSKAAKAVRKLNMLPPQEKIVLPFEYGSADALFARFYAALYANKPRGRAARWHEQETRPLRRRPAEPA